MDADALKESTGTVEVTVNEINIEPNYKAFFKMWVRESNLAIERIISQHGSESLKVLLEVLAPLNVAINSTSSVEEVVEFRELIFTMVQDLTREIRNREIMNEELVLMEEN